MAQLQRAPDGNADALAKTRRGDKYQYKYAPLPPSAKSEGTDSAYGCVGACSVVLNGRVFDGQDFRLDDRGTAECAPASIQQDGIIGKRHLVHRSEGTRA